MRFSLRLVVAALALGAAACSGPGPADQIAGLPLHVKRLNEKAIRIWAGDYGSLTAQTAFATSKGVVVVDTANNPTLTAMLREEIAKELGRNDFTMLINTHEHADHTGGNSVYSDCTIVAHELVAEAMSAPGWGYGDYDSLVIASLAEDEKKLEAQEPGSREASKMREHIVVSRLNLPAATQKPVLPTKTFTDRLTLDMGDTTFELYFIGGMHSASDIAVLVPEHRILLTGDTMADRWLNETPGCSARFAAETGVRHDFPSMIANWDAILARKHEITLLLPAHTTSELSLEGAQARVEYVRTLWAGAHAIVEHGKGFVELEAEYSLDRAFPALAESPGFDPGGHRTTLTEIWRIAAKQQSAAATLYALIDEGAPDAAIRKVLAERDTNGSYYFTVDEINAYGHRFLQEDKVPKAIALFALNAELFPWEWSVYDSLGEALLRSGNLAGAKAMYEKSVLFNPNSVSGKAALASLANR